jgi:hypothetical protein
MNGRKNSGAIISDSDCFSLLGVTHAYENLVHAFGAKGSFHEVGNSDSSNERLLKQNERVFLRLRLLRKFAENVARQNMAQSHSEGRENR